MYENSYLGNVPLRSELQTNGLKISSLIHNHGSTKSQIYFLKTVAMKIIVFVGVMSGNLVHIYRNFRGIFCFILQCRRNMKSVARCSAMLSRVEAGSNTSTVALRVVGGDEKGIQCLGV
jgi:hypothetical protein